MKTLNTYLTINDKDIGIVRSISGPTQRVSMLIKTGHIFPDPSYGEVNLDIKFKNLRSLIKWLEQRRLCECSIKFARSTPMKFKAILMGLSDYPDSDPKFRSLKLKIVGPVKGGKYRK